MGSYPSAFYIGMERTDITAFILAGGKSTRFGSDKAFHKVEGIDLIDHAIRVLSPLVGNIVIVTDGVRRFDRPGIREYADVIPELGPVGGILTALEHLETARAFITACDMPSMSPDLIIHMIGLSDGYDVVVPFIDGWYEPLHAVYSRACLDPVKRIIAEGRRQILKIYDEVSVRTLDRNEVAGFADPSRVFTNINYPKDIETLGKKDD